MVVERCVYPWLCVCETILVSRQPEADVAWGDVQRLRLRSARAHAGHDMRTCAQILRTEFGIAAASQPNVSRWEAGAIKRPNCVNELLVYCDAYGPGTSSTAGRYESRTGQADDATSTDRSHIQPRPASYNRSGHSVHHSSGRERDPSPTSTGDEVDDFDRLAGQAAGEPLLGAAQLELVRGMSRRLASGPPLSSEDRATYLDQLRILRVPDG
jgi:hypothetical protein